VVSIPMSSNGLALGDWGTRNRGIYHPGVLLAQLPKLLDSLACSVVGVQLAAAVNGCRDEPAVDQVDSQASFTQGSSARHFETCNLRPPDLVRTEEVAHQEFSGQAKMPSRAMRTPMIAKASVAMPLAIFSQPCVLDATTPLEKSTAGATPAHRTSHHLRKGRRKLRLAVAGA
jgi:hypothetical protein